MSQILLRNNETDTHNDKKSKEYFKRQTDSILMKNCLYELQPLRDETNQMFLIMFGLLDSVYRRSMI